MLAVSSLFKRVPWKAIGAFAAVAGVCLGVFLAYRHYTGLVEDNKTLTINNVTLTRSIEDQRLTIERQAEAIEDWSEALADFQRVASELQRAADAARAETRRLNGVFARHDLEALALAKPGLVEGRINAGTDDVLRMLECATGADGADCPRRDSPTG